MTRAVLDAAAGFPGRVAAMGYVPDEDARRLLAGAEAIGRAISRLETPLARAMQRRCMLAASGWEGPARVYESVYRRALGR